MGLSALLGIAIGAVLTYVFTRSHEQEKHYRLLQTGAYADYLRCVAQSAHATVDTDTGDLSARAVDAKLRICLYGTPEAIALLQAFEKAGACLYNTEQRSLFAELIRVMRPSQATQIQGIEDILFADHKAAVRGVPDMAQ